MSKLKIDYKESLLTAQKYIARLEKENAELKVLRCCENCKNVNLQLHWRESEEIDKRRQLVCGTCGNRKHWEYLGKTVGITETQQLSKAKDLIEDMYDKIPSSHSDYYKDVMERARQFLKEIEK